MGIFKRGTLQTSAPKPELPLPESIGRVRLAVIVGHTKKSQGATMAKPLGMSEYVYNSKVAALMERHAAKFKGLEIKTFFRDIGGIKGAYGDAIKWDADIAIELHFNAFNGKAVGTTNLCTPSSDDLAYATEIQKAMCEVFGRSGMSRGVKAIARADRGGGNVHSFPNGPNCLVEPAFGDNIAEAEMLVDRAEAYALAMVRTSYEWSQSRKLILY